MIAKQTINITTLAGYGYIPVSHSTPGNFFYVRNNNTEVNFW